MARINSVLGPIDTAKLGFTLMHEHTVVTVAEPAITQNYPELLYDNFMDNAVAGLVEAKKNGIDTIVDATTVDLGRDVNLMVEASRRSGVNIIACTGWWLDIPRWMAAVSADQLAELFIRDIRKGMVNTEVKAGILKGASDLPVVTPAEEKILRGVARSHIQTGVPVMLHSYSPGQVGRRQLEILKEEGVKDLWKVKLDHSNDTTDVEYLTWLLEQGCYLGMDRYPGTSPPNASALARDKTLKALIDAGWGHRLLLSHDTVRYTAFVKAMAPLEERKKLRPHGYLHFHKVTIPRLKEWGVSDAVIKGLFVDNPRNFFEGVSR